MLRIYQFTDGAVRTLDVKELHRSLRGDSSMIWVDLENPSEAEEETILVALFDFHPLTIEDCRSGHDAEGHHPKVEDFGNHLFVIFNPVEGIASSDSGEAIVKMEIRTSQLSAYLGSRFLVTHHYAPLRSIDYTMQLLVKNPLALGKGPDFIFHIIIDDVVDNYTPILDRLDEAIDTMEDEIFQKPTQVSMMNILSLKRNIITIRRVAFYQREMLSRLSRGEFEIINREEMIYYRNVYDHLVRMTDVADSYRDMISSLLDGYLSVTSNRLNQVMKVLTIISTIFLPLGVITGFFGMNFKYLPGLEWESGVAITTALMVAVAGGMLWAFKRNNWL
jgi:magnesium transporter